MIPGDEKMGIKEKLRGKEKKVMLGDKRKE